MKHTIAVLVENHFGVLTRVAGLFSARGFNIDSLAVGETSDPEVSRMTVVAKGDDKIVEQIKKQLGKLVEVIKIEDLTSQDAILRELVLVKINVNASTRSDVMQVVSSFRAKIVDVGSDTLTIEVTGNESKVDAMIELLTPFGVREVVRTGQIAMARKTELVVSRECSARNYGSTKKIKKKSKKTKQNKK